METYANGTVEDEMIDSLSYKIDPTANYVQSRQSVSYNAQGSNIYVSGSGSRVIRFVLSGTGQYLDPSTVRFMFTLKNNENKFLWPVGGPWAFFRRCRLYTGAGAIIEDIDYANRVHEMLHLLTSKANRENDCNVEGFGGTWDSDDVYKHVAYTQTTQTDTQALSQWLGTGIPGNGKKTVCFKPLFGLFNQNKYIPLQWCPLTVEFELVTDALEPIASAAAGTVFTSGNTSQQWQLEDCQIKADVIELDSAVHNEYALHLQQSKPIPITYTSYITQLQAIANGTIACNITRSCSRLKSIFVSFDKSIIAYDGVTDSRALMKKSWNTFFHPMMMGLAVAKTYNSEKELEVHVLVGNKPFPVFPTRSGAEQLYQLKKSLGIHGSNFHSISIDKLKKYMSDHFIFGIDTEKVLGASFSGINCRQDLITIKAKPVSGFLETAELPDQIYVVLQPDYVLEIRETGCLVID